MITNVGVIDRTVRLAVAFGLLGWDGGYFGPPLPGISSRSCGRSACFR